MIDEMASLLHNAGMNALSVPYDKSADSWNKYRYRIAAELIAVGVILPNAVLTNAMHSDSDNDAHLEAPDYPMGSGYYGEY